MYGKFTFVKNTIGNSPKDPKPSFWKVMNPFSFISICKFASLKDTFAMITSLSKLYFKFRRFIFYGLWQLHKQLKTMKMSKAWLILAMRDKYVNSNLNPLAKFTSSSRSTVFKDVHPWNISQMITKAVPVSPRIVKSYVMRQGILLWIWWKVTGNWDSNMIRISRWTESHCRTNTSVRRKKWIQKSSTIRITVWDLSRKVKQFSKVVWDRKIIAEFTRSSSSTRIG